MTYRIPNALSSPSLQLDLQRIKSQYSGYVAQISTGLQNVNLGDDPSSAAMVLDFQSSIDQNNQYMAQISTATSYLQNTSSAVSSVSGDITTLQQLAEEGMSGQQSATSLSALAAQVNAITSNLLGLANTQVEGKYIFGGTNTTTPPFSTTAPAGEPDSYTYNGNSSTISMQVGASTTTPTNVTGDSLFLGGPAPASYGSSTDLFAAANSLSAALTSGNTAAMQTAYTNLGTIANNVEDITTTVGGWTSGLSTLNSNLTTLNGNLTSVQSSVQSVNMPLAITNLETAQNAQEGTLDAMSKIAAQDDLFDIIA